MKRTKKLLALVLALMMAFTTLVMPAMAADEDEGIMPLGPIGCCGECGEQVEVTLTIKGPTAISVGPCDKVEINHIHDVIVYRERYRCAACGHSGGRIYDRQLCRGGQ